MPKAGIKGQTYLKNAETWLRAKILRDLTMAVSSNEIATKNKGSVWQKYLIGLRDVPIDCEADWEPGNPVFEALKEAFWTEAPLEFLILDGGIRKVGAQGLHASFIVTKFERSEPLEDVMSVAVSLRLAADCPDEPEYVEMGENMAITVIGTFGEDPDNEPT